MKAYEIVKIARHRLEAQPEIWAQGAFAYVGPTGDELSCEPNDPRASHFCLAGLILNTGTTIFHELLFLGDEGVPVTVFRNQELHGKIFDTLETLVPPSSNSDVVGYDSIASWNDAPERTVEEVIELLKKAEEKLK